MEDGAKVVRLNFHIHKYLRRQFADAVRNRRDGSMASVLSKFIVSYVDGTVTMGTLEGYRDTPKKKERILPSLVITTEMEEDGKRGFSAAQEAKEEAEDSNAWMTDEQRRGMLERTGMMTKEEIDAIMKEEGRE
jgi:hypothetical protein